MGGRRGGRAMMAGGMGGGGGGGDTAEVIEFQNRLEITQLTAALAARDKNPKNQAVLKKLEEPVSMSFANETPLDDVLKYIRQATTTKTSAPLPIYVDPVGLQDAERSLNSTVTIDLEGIPLKTSLRLVLKQFGLAYCVRDGVLMISSVRGICEELAEAASELQVSDPGAGDPMIEQMIEQMMEQMRQLSRFRSRQ
jgi:hypothetical protein